MASNCRLNPKPKDRNVTECAVKASHTSVITMCFKENAASIEVNRIRSWTRPFVLTRLWREGGEKALWNGSELLLVTAQNMECITEVTELRTRTQTNT